MIARNRNKPDKRSNVGSENLNTKAEIGRENFVENLKERQKRSRQETTCACLRKCHRTKRKGIANNSNKKQLYSKVWSRPRLTELKVQFFPAYSRPHRTWYACLILYVTNPCRRRLLRHYSTSAWPTYCCRVTILIG